MRPAAIAFLLAVVLAGVSNLLAAGSHAVAGAPAPTPTPLPSPFPQPTPEPTPEPTPAPEPEPTPPRQPPQPAVTISVDREDVLIGQKVVLSGQVTPPPGDDGGERLLQVASKPGDAYTGGNVGQTRVRPDGNWRVVHKPQSNQQYHAVYHGFSGEPIYSPKVRVYADYVPRTYWRKRSGGRMELAMLLSVTASVIDYFELRRLQVYGFRSRRSAFARRLFGLKIFYTDPESSSGRAAAYTLRRMPGLKRIRYVFSCVPERRPDQFGRPDDPVQRQCGRRRIRLPRG